MRTVILLLAFLLVGCQSNQNTRIPAVTATVQSTQGKTEFRRAGADWRPVQAGDVLSAGDELRTDPTALLNMNLGKAGGILTLHSNSNLRIESLTAASPNDPPVGLTLNQGRITGDTLRAPGRPKVLIHTGKGSTKIP